MSIVTHQNQPTNMSFLKSKGFKYLKNFIIGIGASAVLVGALAKIQSWAAADILLTVGMLTEAFIFAFLGLIGPEPDYYWDKLYPGLSNYDSAIQPLAAGGTAMNTPALNGEVVEQQLGGMLSELQTMSKSLSSLKALQDADFTGVSDQIRATGNFYTKLNEAMVALSDTVDDTKQYKAQLNQLNSNLTQLNGVYGNMISAMRG